MLWLRIALARGLIAIALVVGCLVAATQWAAAMLDYQTGLGSPWIDLLGIKVYAPWKLLVWWLSFDAQAPEVFARAGAVAAFGGLASGLVAIGGAAWRAGHRSQNITYGSARWADASDVQAAGLLAEKGIVLGLYGRRYLRHDGPEHVLAVAPTRSGKGIGLVLPTLLTWGHSAVIHDVKGGNWQLIARRLTETLPADGTASRRRLLLMLNEFPALGRLDFFESSLAFLAGYGVRAFLVAQSLHQIDRAYGHNHAILDNCHLRVAFAPNDKRTAKRLSDALGTATELRAQKNLSGRRLSAWLSHVSMSEQETPRPLLTAGEILQLPDRDALVLASGSPPIRARKLKYFTDRNFLDRRLPAPALAEGRFRDTPPARPTDWSGCTRGVHAKLDKAWSEVLHSDADPPRTRELTRARPQPDRHRDLPLFAERAPEPEIPRERRRPTAPRWRPRGAISRRRARVMAKKRYSLYLTPPLARKFELVARQRHGSRSALFEEALRANLEPQQVPV